MAYMKSKLNLFLLRECFGNKSNESENELAAVTQVVRNGKIMHSHTCTPKFSRP